MPDDPAKPPQFPYIAALLCVACVGAAAWTWMRFSYCSQITPRDAYDVVPLPPGWERDKWFVLTITRGPGKRDAVYVRQRLVGAYVEMSGKFQDSDSPSDLGIGDTSDGFWSVLLGTRPTGEPHDGATVTVRGRLLLPGPLELDNTASRLHGASIAGLVVGAMGAFVFTVALQHWLRERTRFREEARA